MYMLNKHRSYSCTECIKVQQYLAKNKIILKAREQQSVRELKLTRTI